MAEAASVPLVALTAWQVLVERAKLRPGQKVLIHAGSGGVGTYAIQLAKHLGATVTTTTGTSNVEWVRDLGADVVIDYRTQDFETSLTTTTSSWTPGAETRSPSRSGPQARRDSHRHRRPARPKLRPPPRTPPPAAPGHNRAEPKDAPNRAPPRRALLVPLDARQRCATRRDHPADRDQRPPTHRRPNISIRPGPAGPRPRRKRPHQGQGRHHNGLTHSGAPSVRHRAATRRSLVEGAVGGAEPVQTASLSQTRPVFKSASACSPCVGRFDSCAAPLPERAWLSRFPGLELPAPAHGTSRVFSVGVVLSASNALPNVP